MNRSRVLYMALDEVGAVGHLIGSKAWDIIVTIGHRTTTPQSRQNMTELMENLGMVQNHSTRGNSVGVEVLPDGLKLV